MVDLLIIIVLLVILGVAIMYIVKAKKRGERCVGCPNSGNCGHGQNMVCRSGKCKEN